MLVLSPDGIVVSAQIIAVHADDPEFKGYDDISQLPKHRLAEIRRQALPQSASHDNYLARKRHFLVSDRACMLYGEQANTLLMPRHSCCFAVQVL